MTNTATWTQVKELLTLGVSVVAVRDREEIFKGKPYPAKTPTVPTWKKWQQRLPTEEEVYKSLEDANTQAIATICGAVSGGLFIIDLDTKHYPGVAVAVFTHIRDLYPELFQRLRIHQTPSGGFHILYFIDGAPVPRSKKIAYLDDNPKSEAGIETRGEGGYAVSPPSLNYRVYQDRPIPRITSEEHESLLTICRHYNKRIKKDKYVVKERKQIDYYEENPWQHFNNSPVAETILQDAGWKYDGRSGHYVHYTRPGKDVGVSATFDETTRLYYFFTTSTEHESARWFSPGTVLATEMFAGDRKAAFKWLVANGYGRIKSEVELKIVHRAAVSATPLPGNVSAEARAVHEKEIQAIVEKYPHGIYWENAKEKVVINPELFLQVARGLGFRLFREYQICEISGFQIHKRSDREFIDKMKAYIQELEHPDYQLQVLAAYEKFMQESRKYMISRLDVVPTDQLVLSKKDVGYKFYRNTWLRITAEAIEKMDYTAFSGLIWADQIQHRDFSLISDLEYSKSIYFDFLNKAIGVLDNDLHVLKVLGYLVHEYKDEEHGYIVVLTEQCPDPKQGGGSGKNLFGNLLSHTTSFKAIPGSQVQYNEKFLQSWNFERVLSVNDAPKRFDFMFLKNISSNEAVLKKLFKDEITIDSNSTPKIIVNTNYSYEVSDGGLKRRIIPVEFTDFFTRAGGVQEHYKKMFPSDWNTAEWLAYDNIMVHAVQLWLQCGRLSIPGLTAGGWVKQFEQTYNADTHSFIKDHIQSWLIKGFINNDIFQGEYLSYLDQNGDRKYKLTSKRLNDALRSYCDHEGIGFESDVYRKINSIPYKGRTFVKISNES